MGKPLRQKHPQHTLSIHQLEHITTNHLNPPSPTRRRRELPLHDPRLLPALHRLPIATPDHPPRISVCATILKLWKSRPTRLTSELAGLVPRWRICPRRWRNRRGSVALRFMWRCWRMWADGMMFGRRRWRSMGCVRGAGRWGRRDFVGRGRTLSVEFRKWVSLTHWGGWGRMEWLEKRWRWYQARLLG